MTLQQAFTDHIAQRPKLSGPLVQRTDLGGDNLKFTDLNDKRWIIKASNGWLNADEDYLHRPDMHEREEFFSVLANWRGVQAIPAWKMPTPSRVAREIERQWQQGHGYVRDSVLATEDRSNEIESPPDELSDEQAEALSRILIFCFWVGDEDRKVRGKDDSLHGGDVLWIRGVPHLIDQSLSGPPTIDAPPNMQTECRGCHFQRFDETVFSTEQVLKMAPSGYPSVVAYLIRDQKRRLPPDSSIITFIEEIQKEDLRASTGIAGLEKIAEKLCARSTLIRSDYEEWRDKVHALLGC